MYQNGYLYIVHLLTRDIAAAAARDGVPVQDADGIARHMVSAITGWVLQEAGHRDPPLTEIEAFAKRVVDLLIAARHAW
jgi:hypothetical protein